MSLFHITARVFPLGIAKLLDLSTVSRAFYPQPIVVSRKRIHNMQVRAVLMVGAGVLLLAAGSALAEQTHIPVTSGYDAAR